MIYKLERRGTGLAMPASLFNFLMQNHIKYTYDFTNEGIEITEDAFKRIQIDFKPYLESKMIKYTSETQKTLKTQNMKSQRKKLF